MNNPTDCMDVLNAMAAFNTEDVEQVLIHGQGTSLDLFIENMSVLTDTLPTPVKKLVLDWNL